MRRIIVCVLLVGLALIALHYWRSPERMGELRLERLGRPGDDVVVGVSWPFADDHDGLADGLRLAQEEINAGGGKQVQLVTRNSRGMWSSARGIAMEFARDTGMSAVIGYHDDSLAIRASSIYESSRLLHLVVGATSTALTDHDDHYVVHTLVGADKVARSLAQAGGGQRYALVWEKDGEWDSLVAAYKVAQDNRGASIVLQQAYNREHVDFRRTVNELKTVAADVVLFVGGERAAGDFLARANAGGLPQAVICVCADTSALKALASAGANRTMLLDFYDENSPRVIAQNFAARYKARFGHAPDTWAAQGYDALKLIGQAMRVTGSRRPDDLALALRYLPAWEGANGVYKFDEHGEIADKPVFLKRYRDGETISSTAAFGTAEVPLRQPATGIGATPTPPPPLAPTTEPQP